LEEECADLGNDVDDVDDVIAVERTRAAIDAGVSLCCTVFLALPF
jgi:hypothetical protein